MFARIDKNYIVQINEKLPVNIPGDGHFLFYTEKYQNLHPGLVYDRFYLIHERERRIEGQISFEQDFNSRISIAHGTFGSAELNFKSSYSLISGFLKIVTDYLKERHVQSIIIRHYPDIYDPANSPNICSAFSHLGFRVKAVDINHHLPVQNNFFTGLINKMEKRQLSKCMEMGLKFNQGDFKDAVKIYERISAFRKARRIPLTYSLQDFKNCLEKLPEHYSVFYVTDSSHEIIAATLLVRITDKIVYYFFPADTSDRKSLSPMLVLLDGIYSFAHEHDYQYIDLGISSVNGKPQPGLIQFKENIGGIPSARLTFELII